MYHTDVGWLSRGSALQRFYSLKEEIGQYLAKKGQPIPELTDSVWLADFSQHNMTSERPEHEPSGAKCSDKPTVLAYQSLSDEAATFPVTNAAQYHTFPISARNNDPFSSAQYQCANEEVRLKHLISG